MLSSDAASMLCAVRVDRACVIAISESRLAGTSSVRNTRALVQVNDNTFLLLFQTERFGLFDDSIV